MAYMEQSSKPSKPARYFVEFKSKAKSWTVWDSVEKEKTDLGETIEFIPLKQTSSIKGFNNNIKDTKKNGIWSNEVENFAKQKVTVFANSNTGSPFVLFSGLYADPNKLPIKLARYSCKQEAVMQKENGFKIQPTKHIYAKIKGFDELAVINLQGSGSAAFGKFFSKTPIGDNFVTVTEYIEDSHQGNKYNVPVFGLSKCSDTEYKKGAVLFQQTQDYLDAMRDYEKSRSGDDYDYDELEDELAASFDAPIDTDDEAVRETPEMEAEPAPAKAAPKAEPVDPTESTISPDDLPF